MVNSITKERLGAAIFKSAETEHLILLCYSGADLKMVSHNRPLSIICRS